MRFVVDMVKRIQPRQLLLGLLVAFTCGSNVSELRGQFVASQPHWIWEPTVEKTVPTGTCHFRKTIDVRNVEAASIHIAAYDRFVLYVNGKEIGVGDKDGTMFDVIDFLVEGKNTFAVKVEKSSDANAGLWARIEIKPGSGRAEVFVSDGTWRASRRALPLWQRRFYSAANWQYARSLQPLGTNRQTGDTPGQSNGQSKAAIVTNPNQRVSPSNTNGSKVNISDQGTNKLAEAAIKSDGLSKPDFRVPRQFVVEHVASHFDVGSVIAMTFNEFGQIVVSTEGGSLRLLFDSNGDGSFDGVRKCSELVKNVQGIAAVNGQLFVTGEGPDGSALYRLADADGDGFFEQSTPLVKFGGTPGEHGAHAVTLGPDGQLYVLVGNHAHVIGATNDGPFRNAYEGDLVPRFEDPGGHANGVKSPGGTVVRVDPKTLKAETFAGGLRNPYDIVFDGDGQLFTHDSDMESDEGTTWYRPTQLFHVVAGADLGWRSGWAKWPDYFIDALPPIADTGRGSPAGMTIYEHHAYPEKYRGTVFTCDWTGGQILVTKCDTKDAGYSAASTTFLKGTPLNATDIEVGPDGWLYFSTGGRGTRGSIYRVVWNGIKTNSEATSDKLTIDSVVKQPQPQSAWARQQIAVAKKSLGTKWSPELRNAILDSSRPIRERVQGLQIMGLHGPKGSDEFLIGISRDPSPAVRAQTVKLIASSKTIESGESTPLSRRLVEMLDDSAPTVRREACIGLAKANVRVTPNQFAHILASEDPFEALPARRLLEKQPIEQWESTILKTDSHRVFLQGATAMMVSAPTPERGKQVIGRSIHMLQDYVSDRDFLDLLRVLQLTLHRTELKAADVPDLAANMAEEFPSSDAKINRELIRLLAYLQVDSIMDRYLAELERDDIDSAERIHLATHLTFIRSGWQTDQKLKVFKHLDPPASAGNSVPGYLQNVAIDFGKTFNKSETRLAIERGDEYRSAAMAAMMRLPEKLSSEQIEQLTRLDKKLWPSNTVGSKRLKVAIVAVLARDGSDAAVQYLQKLFEEDKSRRVEVSYGLSENITPENWEFAVRSLPLLDAEASRVMMGKLRTITKWPTTYEPYRHVIRAAEKLGDQGAEDAIALLEHWQGFASSQGRVPTAKAIIAWKRWYAKTYPDAPAIDQPDEAIALVVFDSPSTLTKTDGHWDYDSLISFVQSSEISKGSATAGLVAFSKAECAKCHRYGEMGETVGPDLTDVAKRFRAAETLESIVHPSKVVSQQYASKTIVTVDGITHTGIVAAGASDEVVVLKSDGRKVRIPKSEIEEISPQSTSVMPAGLLDRLTEEEIRDLFTLLTNGETRIATKPQASK